MNYNDTVAWLFHKLAVFQQQGLKAYNGDLSSIKSFTAHLNHPEQKFKSIHVGGTNGKGSTSHMLAAILQEAGYKVGLYTSPHLKDFRERIKINGQMMSKQFAIQFVKRNHDFILAEGLTFFEVTVAMAFDYFAKQKVDIAIVEVGMGGRFDGTNIITPEVSVITNIGLDHVAILGDTLQKIAFEKAGIIKKNTPVVISEYQEKVLPVFLKKANDENAALYIAEKEITKSYKTDLRGVYQQKNIKAAVMTAKLLKGYKISANHIKKGLETVVRNTGLLGRWQILCEAPKVICDTAHNKEGLTLTMNQLKVEKYNTLHIVFGMVKGKDFKSILPLLPKEAIYYFSVPNNNRALPVDVLLQEAINYGLNGTKFTSVKAAYKKAKDNALKEDVIYVGGSTFVVAEIV